MEKERLLPLGERLSPGVSSMSQTRALWSGREKVRDASVRRLWHSYTRRMMPSPLSACLTTSMMTFAFSERTSEQEAGSVPAAPDLTAAVRSATMIAKTGPFQISRFKLF